MYATDVRHQTPASSLNAPAMGAGYNKGRAAKATAQWRDFMKSRVYCHSVSFTFTTRMTLSRAQASSNAADPAKIVTVKRVRTHALCGGYDSAPHNRNRSLTLTLSVT